MKMRNIEILKNLANKKNIFTIQDMKEISGLNNELSKKILFRLEKKGWIERIEKGKYIIIPLEAKKGKYTINEFIIGSLLIKPYCIAYWSALNYYGMTEQIPTTVFIQTTSRKKKQTIDIFGVKYKIIRVKEEKFFGQRKEWFENIRVMMTDREKTIIDCLDKPQYCGGIIEVIKALKDSKLDYKKLINYAERSNNSGVIRRLGYLNEILILNIEVPQVNTKNYLFLDPTMPHEGPKISKWRLINNLPNEQLRNNE
jgi:predicted transcriptional regulator of viral defense system